jgi:hypothetical protein
MPDDSQAALPLGNQHAAIRQETESPGVLQTFGYGHDLERVILAVESLGLRRQCGEGSEREGGKKTYHHTPFSCIR